MRFFDRAVRAVTGQALPLRGRVHKVSVVRGGEVSVVVRFGIEEQQARSLNQGALLEIDVVPFTAGKVAVAILEADKKKRRPPDLPLTPPTSPGDS